MIKLIPLLLLTGCGTFNQLIDGTPAESILISEGKVGGMYGLFTGEIDQCHVVKYGKLDDVVVIYDGVKCEVKLNGGSFD